VPFAPTAGVVHPTDGESDTNVVPAGNVSLQLKTASSGPATFPAVTVYCVLVPAVLVSDRTAFVMVRSAVPVIRIDGTVIEELFNGLGSVARGNIPTSPPMLKVVPGVVPAVL
jgi:hypothetical protein